MIENRRRLSGLTSRAASAERVPASANKVLVTVLAAGASRRLGQPKQLVKLEGEPLVRRQCGMAIKSQIGPVAVILGSSANECVAAIDDLPVIREINPLWSEGLASSIRYAARAAIDMDVDGLLLLQVDQYRLTIADLQLLYATWEESPACVCVAMYGADFGPPALFPRHCFAALLQLAGDGGARRVITSLPLHAVRRISISNAIHDLDEPSQLAALLNSTDSPVEQPLVDE